MKTGEKILLYGGKEFLVEFEPGKELHTHLGKIILPPDLDFGDVIKSSTGKDFVVLRPSTSDLMKDVQRKTTIIYPKDAGIMVLEAGIRPGSVVAEAGTGSGSLTLVLSLFVGEKGKVYSFEKRKEFLELAEKNLKISPWENYHLIERDVYKDGFGEIEVDALFIDLPEPWEVVKHAHRVLKKGSPWISLSPNMEQVKQTVLTLRSENFLRIKTFEIMKREMVVRSYGVRPKEIMRSHTGYITIAWRGK